MPKIKGTVLKIYGHVYIYDGRFKELQLENIQKSQISAVCRSTFSLQSIQECFLEETVGKLSR